MEERCAYFSESKALQEQFENYEELERQDGVYSDDTANVFFNYANAHNMERYSNSNAKGQHAYERQMNKEELYGHYLDFRA